MALTLLSGRTSRLLSSVTGSWRQPHILGAPLNHARRGLECRHWSSSSKLLIPSLNEHELINHTTGGWLYNHDRQISNRRLYFNAHALIHEAIKSTGATACVKFEKMAEGTANTFFDIHLDNGAQVVAKLPLPIAGPAHLTTASEVATMTFAREECDIPGPRVLSWCSHADRTPVNSEYILMEKSPGQSLNTQWSSYDGPSMTSLMHEVVDIESILMEPPFPVFGSLYFDEDLDVGIRRARLNPVGTTFSRRYSVGPSVDRRFWRDGRYKLDINRGPWDCITAYSQAVIDCEIAWLSRFAQPRAKDDPLFKSLVENDPARHIERLERFAKVAPFLNPLPEYRDFRLRHPLRAANIHVSPDSDGRPEITAVHDWQNACIEPLILTNNMAECMVYEGGEFVEAPNSSLSPEHVRLPNSFHALDTKRKNQAMHEKNAAITHLLYNQHIKETVPELHKYRAREELLLLQAPLLWATGTWNNGLTALEGALIGICDCWHTIAPATPCPITFTAEERAQNQTAAQLLKRQYEMSSLAAVIGIREDGWVRAEHLEAARMKEREVKEQYLASVAEAERGTLERLWPFRDGALSMTAERCRD